MEASRASTSAPKTRRGRRQFLWAALLSAAFGFVPLNAPQAQSDTCQDSTVAERAALPFFEGFPVEIQSPQAALQTHDVAFLAEVAVPSRPCTLGACAGLRVLSRAKGVTTPTVLMRVSGDGDRCKNPLFQRRGERWVVFANFGMSPRGQAYLDVDRHGPTYPSVQLPDFAILEHRYRRLSGELDAAISARLNALR